MTMMTTSEKNRLKHLASQNIGVILDALDVDYDVKGELYQSCCPVSFHPGDNDNETAFSWRQGMGWVCWTHSCDQMYGNDVYSLVSCVLNISFRESLTFVRDVLNGADVDSVVMDQVKVEKYDNINRVLNPKCLDYLEQNYNYPLDKSLVDRGFDPKILMKYEVGYWESFGSFMHQRMVFPVRDHSDLLVGFTGRTIFPQSNWEIRRIKSKWIHNFSFIEHPDKEKGRVFYTGTVLYNLNRAKSFIENSGVAILVEGPLDGLKLEQAGIHNWVAIMGVKNFSDFHVRLLNHCNTKEIWVAFDPDNAGQSGAAKIILNLKKYQEFKTRNIKLPGKDPGDMEEKDLRKYLS